MSNRKDNSKLYLKILLIFTLIIAALITSVLFIFPTLYENECKTRINEDLEEKLKGAGMWELYQEIEMPLVYTLHEMEQEGVQVNGEELRLYGENLSGKITELEQEIYQDAGEEFNINSPKQLGVILVDKLKMPYGKKTKTGYSTAADVLDKLAGDYPLVSKILEYRQLAKLKSTYADGLSNFIDADFGVVYD